MPDLILTLVGTDHPGIVEKFAKLVADNGGNWLESRMAHLAGKFAGILHVEVAPENLARLTQALAGADREGFKVAIETSEPAAESVVPVFELDLVGSDKPGIVREISGLLSSFGVNIEDLTTDRVVAPMSGEKLFRARSRLRLPENVDLDTLRRRLEAIASDLMVDVKLVEPQRG